MAPDPQSPLDTEETPPIAAALDRLTREVARLAAAVERIPEFERRPRQEPGQPWPAPPDPLPGRTGWETGLGHTSILEDLESLQTGRAPAAPPAGATLQAHRRAATGFDFSASCRSLTRILEASATLEAVQTSMLRLGWTPGDLGAVQIAPEAWSGISKALGAGLEGSLLLFPSGGGEEFAVLVAALARGPAGTAAAQLEMLPLVIDRTSLAQRYLPHHA